ncbi:hypothetical protein HDV05_005009 [Chytridiales sp. JEL 0842]|nr:hypothetical protein HDV05_005009 [Chytridiales sp. JEL 0842]
MSFNSLLPDIPSMQSVVDDLNTPLLGEGLDMGSWAEEEEEVLVRSPERGDEEGKEDEEGGDEEEEEAKDEEEEEEAKDEEEEEEEDVVKRPSRSKVEENEASPQPVSRSRSARKTSQPTESKRTSRSKSSESKSAAPVSLRRLVRPRRQLYDQTGERLYCTCLQPDNGQFMIQCDKCKDWYHGSCVGITEKRASSIDSYECKLCKEFYEEMRKQHQEESEYTYSLLTFMPLDGHQGSASDAAGTQGTSSKPPPVKIPSRSNIDRRDSQTSLKSASSSSTRVKPERQDSTSSVISSPWSTGSAAGDFSSAATPSAIVNDVGPDSTAWMHDKVRKAVRNVFTDTFKKMIAEMDSPQTPTPTTAEAQKHDDEDLNEGGWSKKVDPAVLAAVVEDELFDLLAEGERGHGRTCGDKANKKNTTLRVRILKGTLTPYQLVRLEAKDLANDEIKARSEEIRLQSIRDAIKPKELEMGYVMKKTHKGEEEIVQPEGGRFRGVDADNKLKDPVPPPPVRGSAKIASLDDLLSKISGGSSSSTTSAREKRASPSEHADDQARDTKKARTDDTPSNEIDSAMSSVEDLTPSTSNFGSSAWDSTIVTQGWESAGDLSGMDLDGGYVPRSPVNDYTGADNTTSASGPPYEPRSPSHSPPPLPESHDTTPTWTGLVRMPQVAKFFGSSHQVAGRRVHGGSKAWEDILPPNVNIEGRIDTRRVIEYVSQQLHSTSKEVVVIEFKVSPDAGSEETEGFQSLFNYFHEKNRFAVVGHNYINVKDMYLVPVKAGMEAPEMMTRLPNCEAGLLMPKAYDAFYGVIVLDKNLFNKKKGSVSHGGHSHAAARSGSSRGHGSHHHHHHVSDKSKDTLPATLPPPPPIAGLPTPANPLFPAAPAAAAPVAAPSSVASVLASLAALTQAQQHQQQAAANPVLGLNLLNSMQTSNQQAQAQINLAALVAQLQSAAAANNGTGQSSGASHASSASSSSYTKGLYGDSHSSSHGSHGSRKESRYDRRR